MGYMPGSMGETSALACLIGAFILLIATGDRLLADHGGRGRSAPSSMSMVLNAVGSHDGNPLLQYVPWYWHFVLGGWAFGARSYMATDPVSAAAAHQHRPVDLRISSSACSRSHHPRASTPRTPKGWMLAILSHERFRGARSIYYVVRANIKQAERALCNVTLPTYVLAFAAVICVIVREWWCRAPP